jgi:[heparan sulfate]-glucosamine 3-sulfotransferase 2
VLVLGARKGGSTSLYEYLARHPAFDGVKLDSGAQSGELLFLRKLPYTTPPATVRERYDAEFVRARFEPVQHSNAPLPREELMRQASAWVLRVRSGAALTGESDVGNGPNCAAPLQVSGACGPDMRLVYLVRSPVERLVSVYRMRRRLGTVADPSLSLDQFARRDLEQMQAALAAAGGANADADANDSATHWWEVPRGPPCLFENDWLNSVWSGLYVVHLARWLQHYDRAAMRVVKSEELFRHPAEVYDDTLRFIGLDPMDVDAENVTATKYNAAPQQPHGGSAGRDREDELAPGTRLALRDFFAPYNLALQERFGIDVSDWS